MAAILSLETTVSRLETITVILGLIAAVSSVVAFVAGSLYFLYKRRKHGEKPQLEAIATWFGVASGVFALMTSFSALGYSFKNSQLQALEKQEQIRMQGRIADVNAKAEEAVRRQKELENENLRLNALLEKERLERVELEQALYYRRTFDSELAIKDLMAFAGTRVIIEWKETEEAAGLASQIAYSLQEAKWNLAVSEKPGLTSELPFQTGVLGILVRCSPGKSLYRSSDIPNSCDRPVAAGADALVREIRQNNLRVWRDFRLPVPN